MKFKIVKIEPNTCSTLEQEKIQPFQFTLERRYLFGILRRRVKTIMLMTWNERIKFAVGGTYDFVKIETNEKRKSKGMQIAELRE